MDFVLLGGVVPAAVWLPIVAAAASGYGVGLLIAFVRRRRMQADLRAMAKKGAEDRDRADAAEHDLAAERARSAPLAEGHQHLVSALARCFHDLEAARDKSALAQALANSVERLYDPAQYMVFTAVDRDGREFRLAASGGRRDCGWQQGARMNDSMGRLGLVARRKASMDTPMFDSEPPIVREQFASTEPEDFVVDAAAPVLVGGVVAAIVSVGGSSLPLDPTRGGLDLLAPHASLALRAIDAAARVERLKNTDEMTGLGSRSWFVAEGAEALYRCRSEDAPSALVVFGIDDFQGYVKRSGHEAADWLLKGVGEAIRPHCREGALLARWSGAEFVVLLPGVAPRGARLFADRVRGAVSGVDWPNGAAQAQGHLTLSAGVAFLPANGSNLEELIESAAESLAAARWTGDATHSAYAPSPGDAAKPHDGGDVSESRESAPTPSM